MSEINIVNIIEEQSISNLSNTYNNKLLLKVKDSFTESQQKLFISTFYCCLNYSQTNDFIIDLDDLWKWLEFSQKEAAKRLLEKHFKINIDYKKIENEKKEKTRGGHNKEKIMLNLKTFKLLCLKAGTKKSDEIHDYFIKLGEILQDTLNEECNELNNQIQQINLTKEKTQKLDREKMLLKEFGTKGALVYIIKVKSFENGEYILKIGESRKGVLGRYNEHKSHYEECLLVDCFSVKHSREFEKFIHHHEKIRSNKYTQLPNHTKENELFLIGRELTYDMLVQIINDNLKKFDDYDEKYIEKLHTEIDCLNEVISRLQNKKTEDNPPNNTIISPFPIEIISQLSEQIRQLEQSNKEILEKVNSMQIKTNTGFNQPLSTVGDRVQKINPETLQLIKVYESVAEVMKESNHKIKRSSLLKAVSENTIYHGFRWTFIDRNIDPNQLYDIQPTKKTRPQNLGYIAKLNADKTEILNIYLDRKTAAVNNGYTISALDTPVRNGSLTNNHYYMLFDKCPDELIQKFNEKNGEPILYKDGIGQYQGNQLIKEFLCKNDCIKRLQMSDKTLRKALDLEQSYNGFTFRQLGAKLFI
jgi:phage anti-repressor protein